MTLVTYSVQNRVATLRLNNPPANAYSTPMFEDLDVSILKARRDPEVDVLLLTGAGQRFFCAGADIDGLSDMTPDEKYYFCLHANETLLRLEHTPKLVIAAMNGHCVGGGLEVAMAADLRVAAHDMKGKIGLPEVALGVLPGTGGTQRLTQLIGRSRAIEFMANGHLINAEEACALGLINQLLTGSDFNDAAQAYAEQFCQPVKSSRAIGHIKRAVVSGCDLPLESGLALERELQQRLFSGPDAKEGLAAFRGKRPPEFGAS